MCYFSHRFTLPSQFSVFIVCSGSQLEFDWQNDIPMIPKMLRKYEVLLFCLQIEVCAAQEVNINPLLLEKFIQSCDRDIHKSHYASLVLVPE
ncbi:unnamed protein product [Trifolium pratense]|uniref:Uncharacterized protein n=1 Tax=Trifolium pratense TaxID=57577 RepID=A0ACB0LGI7_TRIPR|nr:unnamed protein product [Trifolium pratense]